MRYSSGKGMERKFGCRIKNGENDEEEVRVGRYRSEEESEYQDLAV